MIQKAFKISIIVFCVSWITKYVLMPTAGFLYFRTDFMALSSQCSEAMDESWFVEQKNDPQLNKTAKIHLLICHDYDKTRKIMLMMGVSENALAYLGLEALELHQRSADEMVELHRFQAR